MHMLCGRVDDLIAKWHSNVSANFGHNCTALLEFPFVSLSLSLSLSFVCVYVGIKKLDPTIYMWLPQSPFVLMPAPKG